MTDSILTNTKKNLGIEEAYTQFDPDIIMAINSAFATLNQLGIGPEDGFAIVDKTSTWDAFIGTNLKYNSVKTYVYMKVRLVFDPPGTSYAIQSFEQQTKELEWRLNAVREETAWVPPSGVEDVFEEVIDGGTP